ncbi:MAG: hypothetical protein ACLU99_10405 [Alphaproteobacteria bacterium]
MLIRIIIISSLTVRLRTLCINSKNTDVKDFVGNKADGSYGAVDIGYYGETKDNPSEAAGYVAYGERYNNSTNLHAQIGFGAVKK